MEKLPYPILTNVLEVISAANESLDRQLVRQKALDALFTTLFPLKGRFSFYRTETDYSPYILLKNLDTAYCNPYKTYFNQI